MQSLKRKLGTVVSEYDKKKKKAKSNLTAQQKRGINSLTERRQNGEVVIFQTDKSSRMAADTATNYIKSMETHISKDEKISKKDLADVEKVINAHSVCWLRMLQAGAHRR